MKTKTRIALLKYILYSSIIMIIFFTRIIYIQYEIDTTYSSYDFKKNDTIVKCNSGVYEKVNFSSIYICGTDLNPYFKSSGYNGNENQSNKKKLILNPYDRYIEDQKSKYR